MTSAHVCQHSALSVTFVPLSPPCPCLLLSVVIVIHSPVTDGPYALRKADHVQARRTGNPRRPSHPPWTFVSTDFNAAGTRLFPASTPPCPPRMFIPLSTNFPQFWIPTPTFHPLGSPAFRVSTFLTPRAPKCLTPSFPQDLSPSPCQAWLPLPLATSSFRPPEPLGRPSLAGSEIAPKTCGKDCLLLGLDVRSFSCLVCS